MEMNKKVLFLVLIIIFNKIHMSDENGINMNVFSSTYSETSKIKNKEDAQKARDFIKNYGIWENINAIDWTNQVSFIKFQKECDIMFELIKEYLNMNKKNINELTKSKKYIDNDMSSFCELIYNVLFPKIVQSLPNETFGFEYYKNGTLNLLNGVKFQSNIHQAGTAIIAMNEYISKGIKDIDSLEIKYKVCSYFKV